MEEQKLPYLVRTGLGQDSHRFLPEDSTKPCHIGGLIFEDVPGMQSSSDGDVICHALCRAISSLTGVLILGGVALDLLKKDGITDSTVYLREALGTLGRQQITHVAITLEGKRPKFLQRIPELRQSIAGMMSLEVDQVGMTATTGEGLTEFGLGEGLHCLCVVTTMEEL